MDIKKVTLTRYSIIVNGADAKKAIKPMQNASVESMFIDVFDENSAVICCATFKDVRNCLAILNDSGCSSAIVNIERVYNECNSCIIKSVTCALNTYIRKEVTKTKDYRNYLEPGVKESFEAAVKALREKVGEAAATIADMRINEALVEYKTASYMYGYFTAMAEAFPDCSKVFYTAATNMIHFRYYHFNEEE